MTGTKLIRAIEYAHALARSGAVALFLLAFCACRQLDPQIKAQSADILAGEEFEFLTSEIYCVDPDVLRISRNTNGVLHLSLSTDSSFSFNREYNEEAKAALLRIIERGYPGHAYDDTGPGNGHRSYVLQSPKHYVTFVNDDRSVLNEYLAVFGLNDVDLDSMLLNKGR